MAAVTKAQESAVFDLKSAALTLIAVVLKTHDLGALAEALEQRFGETPGLFDQDPVAIDLSQLPDDGAALDFAALIALLRRYRMAPVAAKGGSEEQMQAALAHGLAEAADGPTGIATTPRKDDAPERPEVVLTEVIHEVPVPTPVAATTLVIDRPVRAGQQIYARGGDVVVLGVVNFGAEVIADGSIHVYAPLRGRAIAGARGNTAARIYAACMEPQLVAVAGTYRTAEVALPEDVRGKPAQVRLDGERLVVEALEF
jgi:septum site-determining protein MinC